MMCYFWDPLYALRRGKREEGRGKREEGRRNREEGRRKRDEGVRGEG
jgi:hypothetical protein